jgi:hypothetical protein
LVLLFILLWPQLIASVNMDRANCQHCGTACYGPVI